MTEAIIKSLKSYIDEPVENVIVLSGGHINRSLLVTGRERYVLQCLNRRLYADHIKELEHNYLQYRSACEQMGPEIGNWHCPEWLKDRDGNFFHAGSDGNIWRMYRYIPSDDPCGKVPRENPTFDMIHQSDAADCSGRPLHAAEAPCKKPAQPDAFAMGLGLGKLHRILKKCGDIRTIETTAHLHDLEYHYRKYREQDRSEMKRVEELDRSISADIEDMLKVSLPSGVVIHGDAKAGNMMINEGEVTGFIDLDTMMTGSVFDDLADCARSCLAGGSAGGDGNKDSNKLEQLITGYEEGAFIRFTDDERQLLSRNLARNRFMLGMRYYTDYLSREGYFSEAYPMQNLERARELLIRGE